MTPSAQCDGDTVQCSACRLRNQSCEYSQTGHNRKPPSKNYVRALEARIQSLEQELAAARRESRNADAQPAGTSRCRSGGTSMARASDLDVDVITDTLGSFNIGDGGSICYLGSRSNLNLLRCGMPHRASSSPETGRRFHHHHHHRDAQHPSILDGVSEELQTHLLDLFWTWQNSWQRLVARDAFLLSSSTNEFSSPSLVCAMYAIASRYSDRLELRTDPSDPNTAGNAFAAEAKQMLLHECDTPTMTTVQATAILSLYGAAVDKEASGWMYCGMAIRMAISLGLHLDCSRCVNDGEMTAEEAEVRSVTWWGCYVLDKLWTVGLGRPSMIRDRDVTAKMPSKDSSEETLPCPQSFAANPAKPASRGLDTVSCTIYTCELFTASAELLDSIYAPSGKTENQTAIVSDGNLRLVAFYNSLPTSLKLTRSPHDVFPPNVYMLQYVHVHNPPAPRSQPTLKNSPLSSMQYHTTMILLHRPFLTSFRAANGQLGGLRDGSIHATMCRNSADWIVAIFRWYRGHYTLRKIPVSAVHCAFTAAVIFLAAATADAADVRARAALALRALCRALDEMRAAWNWSARALRAVRSIARVWDVELSVSSVQQPPPPREMGGSESAAMSTTATATATSIRDHHGKRPVQPVPPRGGAGWGGGPSSAGGGGGGVAGEGFFAEEEEGDPPPPVDMLLFDQPFVDFDLEARLPMWDSSALFPFDEAGEHRDIWQGFC
ncbi:nitrogen assimilation transcription factor nit-4 [Diplodia corticola]|uniref:Nitrogen assimilation transcription factor nit-4 n=1 Tax=Diplodia corticola TaxID=236234 RepID=A0A1J9RV42_9PEZI|nr:nitrogen assimilation transcription factor nit-4 [Diplodia corticola]OJD36459.1 nitrogen assimilation transcription factor nit-4 [Diplodia corticola]